MTAVCEYPGAWALRRACVDEGVPGHMHALLNTIDAVRDDPEVMDAHPLLCGVERTVVCGNDVQNTSRHSCLQPILVLFVPDGGTHHKGCCNL